MMGDPTFAALAQRIRDHFFARGTIDG
jgi:hypothetical protein